MKILYVTFNFNKGGAGKANLAMVNLLRKYNKVDTLSVKEIFEKRKLVSLRYFPYLFTRLLSRLLQLRDIILPFWRYNFTSGYKRVLYINIRLAR